MKELLEQATALHGGGHPAEAERLYRLILDRDPGQPDALALLGLVLASRKDYAAAIAHVTRAIKGDPKTPLFRLYLGNLYAETDALEKAALAFEEALAIQPQFAEAHYGLALVLEKQGRLHKAVSHLKDAVRLKPREGAAWLKLGELALKIQDFDAAEKAAQNAVSLMPDNVAARVAHALVLGGLYREEEQIEALLRVLQMKPDFIEAWDMLGAAYQQLGRLDDAHGAFCKAVTLAGGTLSDEDKRIADENDYCPQHWDLSLLELLRGDYARGFAHYRARFKNPGRPGRPLFPKPVWQGESLDGKKILIVSEQGFGDVLMMCRFAPLLKEKGATVVLLAPGALVPLLKEANLADEVINDVPDDQGDFDFQASIFDLPLWLGTTLKTIPDASYLPLPPADAQTMLAQTHKPKIGVVWCGNKDHGNDRTRSLPLSVFSSLFEEKNAQFYNLTRELMEGDAAILKQGGVIDLSPRLTDFLVAARLTAQLDLVITCDTAMAHLAGGMGKKVWLLLPFAPDWRWLTGRDDSPWYGTMRLFRQSLKGDWAEVIGRVRASLAAYLKP